MTLVRVALDVPIDELFDYRLDQTQRAAIGQRVIVPFGRGKRAGVIVEVGGESRLDATRIKAVEQVLDKEPPLASDVLELARFCAGYYHYPLGQVVLNVLPPKLRDPTPVPVARRRVVTLTAAGLAALAEMPAHHVRQRTLLMKAAARDFTDELDLCDGVSEATRTLRQLLDRGWLDALEARQAVSSDTISLDTTAAVDLNPAQRAVLSSLRQGLGQYGAYLILGVTGSGKTAVYLETMAELVRARRQVLMLVPEINLTPQLEQRIAERFAGVPMVSLHSDLAEGERLRRWRAAQSGDALIVVGTRLAVFTPMADLGLIVVDEEHDESFKQEEGLRYHARDLAIVRARRANVPVLMGSATPSLETFARARVGRYKLLQLPERAAAQPPRVHCIDTARMQLSEGLSAPLVSAIAARLASKEQSLVFINRRGYSPSLLCYSCGWIAHCGRCSARLVFHSRNTTLRCHYCGHQEIVAQDCPQCGNLDLRPRGHGTQRLERELKRLFPAASIVRVDRDTTQRRQAFADLRDQVANQQIDILVGTQMLAKGHDFPELTLVGVINADAGLFSTDFRAAERMFSLLMQVSGRAGRARKLGEVLIQTEFPRHPVYAAVARQDYAAFAEPLLKERRQTQLPPYCYQALLRAEAGQRRWVDEFLAEAARLALVDADGIEVFDPVPSPMARVAGKERGQLLVQSVSRSNLQTWLARWRAQLLQKGAQKVRWYLDVDPRNI
ncbi:MAG: primosomal protein N' [Betaproteobacteria bacterium]|nr:primosomal protein N' [Betaproteobacteria bacterium]